MEHCIKDGRGSQWIVFSKPFTLLQVLLFITFSFFIIYLEAPVPSPMIYFIVFCIIAMPIPFWRELNTQTLIV